MSDKTKIVMIDDEPDLCVMVKANLEDTGSFDVVTTSEPQDAEKVIGEVTPDVILLDVVMPGRSGQEVVAALKNKDEFKRIPIIMVSGKGEMVFDKRRNEFKWMPNNPLAQNRGDLPDVKGAEALSEAYGVTDYVSKPFNTDLLVQVINDVVERTKKRSSSSEDESGM